MNFPSICLSTSVVNNNEKKKSNFNNFFLGGCKYIILMISLNPNIIIRRGPKDD